MSIETDHINFLIYRYLLESGFQHSSFTFGQESGVARSAIATTHIPPGSLIAQMQRALNYVQAEINLTEDGLPADPKFLEDFPPLSLLESVQPSICEERRKELWQKIQQARSAKEDSKKRLSRNNVEIMPSQIRQHKGHTASVFKCVWNPKYEYIASCAADGTARIWPLEDTKAPPLVCLHPTETESQDVFTIDWRGDGDCLCTGYYDGHVRLWSTHDGDLQQRFAAAGSSISKVKFNANGRYLAAADAVGNVLLWNLRNEKKILSATYHEGCVLALTWVAEDKFVTAGTDSLICMFSVKKPFFMQKLSGHSDEVNAVEWGASLSLLASASDDKTVRLWALDSGEVKHVVQHEAGVGCLTWCSADATSHMLASGANDGSVRLIDARRGVCTHTLKAHVSEVLCLQFSPDGKQLASGDAGCRVIIWNVETLDVVKTLMMDGVVYSLSWSPDGTHIALADGTGNVIDVDLSSN